MSNSLRKPDGTFAPGWRGGGRPPGARSKLSETMLQLLAADVEENGAEVIAEVRRTKPAVWLQCVCSLLPKHLQTEKLSPFSDLSDTEIDLMEQFLRSQRARVVSNGEPEPDKP